MTSRTALKQYQSRRRDRIAKTNDIRANAREQHIGNLRRRMVAEEGSVMIDTTDPWAEPLLKGLSSLPQVGVEIYQSLLTEHLELASLDRLLGLLRARTEDGGHSAIAWGIVESGPIIAHIVSRLQSSASQEHLFKYLQILSELTNTSESVVSILIDSGAVGAVHDLLEQRLPTLNTQFWPPLLKVFCNLASNSDIGTLVCFNYDIPRTFLRILDLLQSNKDGFEIRFRTEIGTIISATFVYLSRAKDYYAWNLVLADYSATLCHALANSEQEIVINFAFALFDIARLIETMSLHELVPVFVQNLLGCLATINEFPQRDQIVGQIVVRLSCTTDEYIDRYLLYDAGILNWLRTSCVSVQNQLRIYFLGFLSNIAGSKDPDAHDFLFQNGFVNHMVASFHLDIPDNRKLSLIGLTNLMCFAAEEHRTWIARQGFILVDIVDCLDSLDLEMVAEACSIIDALITHTEGDRNSLVWRTLASHDFEAKLENLYFNCDDEMITMNAGSILQTWSDIRLTEDESEEEDEQSDMDAEANVPLYMLPPLPGQTRITDFMRPRSLTPHACDEDSAMCDPNFSDLARTAPPGSMFSF